MRNPACVEREIPAAKHTLSSKLALSSTANSIRMLEVGMHISPVQLACKSVNNVGKAHDDAIHVRVGVCCASGEFCPQAETEVPKEKQTLLQQNKSHVLERNTHRVGRGSSLG